MLSDLLHRLRALFRRNAVERELDEEMRFHLEQQVDSYMREGLSRSEAARRARLEFGALEQIRDEHRDARGIGVLSHLGRDLRHGLRQFRRSPGFTALAVLCLGLAIGVNTSIFGVLNSVLLRPMPVQQPERLIVVSRGDTATFSHPTYREFRDRNRTLSGLAASMPSESDLDIDGSSTFVAAEAVSGNYSTVIGVRTAIGRWFSSDAEPAAVISYAVWQRQFNLDPNVLGRTIRSESQSYSIAGVAPREFSGIFSPLRTDIWVPIGTRPSLVALQEDRTARTLMLFGRLADNATPVQASSELNTIEAQLANGAHLTIGSSRADRGRSGPRHRQRRQSPASPGRRNLPDGRRRAGASHRLRERRAICCWCAAPSGSESSHCGAPWGRAGIACCNNC